MMKILIGGRAAKSMLALYTLVILLALLLVTLPGPVRAANDGIYRQLNLFGDVLERIRADYVEEVDDPELIEAAITGMLRSLDPHSSYMPPRAYRDMREQIKGEFGGLGIEVTMENGLVKVVSPIDDTPAARAGMKAGDYITQLDDTPVMGLTLSEAVKKMRGPVNSEIRLLVARQGVEKPFEVKIIRDVIRVQSVRSRLEGDMVYLRITSFTEQTDSGLEKAMVRRKAELGNKFKGVVLDLRNNPGGALDQAIAVSDAFLDKGEIVSTRGRRPEETHRYNAKVGDLAQGLPVAVLINSGSASASEIVAGALQDHHRALVIGTKSFGKGSVQSIIPLQGHGAIRLTTARYYTPSGTSIQAKGIEPDITVEQVRVERAKNNQRRSEADLPKHLKAEKKKAPAPMPKNHTNVKRNGDGVGNIVRPRDFQLSYALDLLRGMALIQRRNGD
ncbi:MAG: S41 family peptidase [Alphaproteobacteria bacterium]|jgi:carboxyl-terminal processing protease|nr:S41 family peptidase [Alphaproteobacteria bacterium]MDP6253095.1 S41 family peptidase [Alphaproteobacteria bacterium]MDP7054991.1 S41 family peptidase [Alphaproteobacteria bacterium]MDP7227730.1 S41 family peptidase [Alphaproteobacteria bacterium]MDP7460275.1 S41 family peptidase [Alphaproteobacteria bacterium]|tara:strand:- start:178 stop:1518 length:1341 start_codon:yes stop_codon:yes gene_type:complete